MNSRKIAQWKQKQNKRSYENDKRCKHRSNKNDQRKIAGEEWSKRQAETGGEGLKKDRRTIMIREVHIAEESSENNVEEMPRDCLRSGRVY